MDTIRPPFAVLEAGETSAPFDEIEVAADASSLDFLQAVYRNGQQPMQRRMRAAIEALPFERPKLAVVQNVYSFAEHMREVARASGKSNVIDAPKSDFQKVEIMREKD
jgi:hypothetical protein